MMRRSLGLLGCLVLLIIGINLWWGAERLSPPSHLVTVPVDAHRKLVGRLYLPASGTAPYPAVVTLHGASSTKEMLDPLSVELARRGIAALALDFGNHGESDRRRASLEQNVIETHAAIAFLRHQPAQFDSSRLGLIGHSMGGDAVLIAAQEDLRLRLAIVLGMRGSVNAIAPKNLLLGIGLYEEFHPLLGMREMLKDATNQPLQEFQPVGDMAHGTARLLTVSPTSDHIAEVFDAHLIQASVNWAAQGFGLTTPPIPLISTRLLIGRILTFTGAVGVAIALCLRHLQTSSHHQRWLSLSLIGVALLGWLLNHLGVVPALWVSNLWMFSLVVWPFCNYQWRYPTRSRHTLKAIGLYLLLIILVFDLIAVGFHLHDLIAHPTYSLGLPQFLIQFPLGIAYSSYQGIRGGIFTAYSEQLHPQWVLLVLLLPEFIWPGLWIRLGEQLSVQAIRWVRQPLTINWQLQKQSRSLALLGVASLLFMGLLIYRWQTGLLSFEMVPVVLDVLLQMMLLPLSITLLIIRSSPFQRLEARWLQRSPFPNH